jgi:hypothetical protein
MHCPTQVAMMTQCDKGGCGNETFAIAVSIRWIASAATAFWLVVVFRRYEPTLAFRHTSRPHLSSAPLVHSNRSHPSSTPIVHTYHFTPLMHASHAHVCRYETTVALPIEYGTCTAADVISGLLFYREYKHMSSWQVRTRSLSLSPSP